MLKGKKYVASDGIEFFMCPFTDMYITAGSQGNGNTLHKGTMANDIRGAVSGIRYAYYAPCKLKCLATYPQSGQSMWQSVNKVRFANGRVDYATIMIAHDDSMNCAVGQVIEQGSQLGSMGTKGNATGVHCHIEISQSNDRTWFKNKYGNYCFNNEYDTDACYFVDDTNILNGLGGSWKKTSDVKIENTKPSTSHGTADQLLFKGSKVKFNGIFKVDMIKTPVSSNLFGCCELTGCSVNDYKNEKVEDYHWLPTDPFVECDSKGNITKDQKLTGGSSYVKNETIYTVLDMDVPTNSAKLNINGREVWVFSTYLYEVADK